MPIRVKLPNGKIGEFPDDMPHSEIESVLSQQFPSGESETDSEADSKPMELTLNKGKEQTGADWRGLAGDTVRMLGRALKGTGQFIGKAPGNIKEIGSELMENPLSYPPHAAQQVLAGLVGGTRDLANLPHKLFDELADRRITPNWLRTGSLPEDTGLEKALGFEPTKKSDELLRAVPALFGAGKLVGKGISKVKEVASRPNKEKLFQRALEERIDKAATESGMSKEALKSLQESLRRDYSAIHSEKLAEPTPIGQQEAINIKQGKLEKLRPATEIAEERVGEIPPEPDLKSIVNEKKSALEKAKAEADKALGTLDNPRLKGAEKVAKAIKDTKQASSDLYNSARNHYAEQKVKVNNDAEMKSISSELEDLSSNGNLSEVSAAERKAIDSQINALKGDEINATDIFDLQRTLEKVAENTRKKQYSGVTDLEFKRLGNVADRLDSQADNLAKRLESVGGKEVKKMISEANKGWKIYKDLSLKNPVGKGALKGELPIRSMIEIAKNHPGNDFLKSLVESDPELKKHILAAYTGESNLNKLTKPTSLVEKYIKDLPEVEEHVQSFKQALQGVKEGEVKASKVKKEYDDLVTSMKEAAKQQKVRQDAIKESDKLKEQIKFHEESIPKIEAKMQKVATDSAQHSKLQKELKDHKKFIEDKGGRIKQLAKFVAKGKGVNLIKLP